MKRSARTLVVTCAMLGLVVGCASTEKTTHAPEGKAPPMYPAWPGADAEDISHNAYGAFKKTPRAPQIGQKVPAFVAPTTDDKGVNLARDVADGPMVAVFYRGFW